VERRKGARGQRKTGICREKEREGTKETVELRARDGSFIIAFSCVVCATVSCSLITMIHSRPPLSLHYVCHSVFVAMINLCTNPSFPEGGGHNAYESTNIITRDGESIGKHAEDPGGIRRALHLLGDKFFFSGR